MLLGQAGLIYHDTRQAPRSTAYCKADVLRIKQVVAASCVRITAQPGQRQRLLVKAGPVWHKIKVMAALCSRRRQVDCRSALRGRAYICLHVHSKQISIHREVHPKQVLAASRSNMIGSKAVPFDPEAQIFVQQRAGLIDGMP